MANMSEIKNVLMSMAKSMIKEAVEIELAKIIREADRLKNEEIRRSELRRNSIDVEFKVRN